MTARLTGLLVAGLFLSACAGDASENQTAPVDSASADRAAIEQIRADYVTHYNAHHASIVADLFADSAFALWSDGNVSLSKAQILANLEADMAASPTINLETGDVMIFGDNAVARGSYNVNMSPPGATGPVTIAGHYLTHFQKVNGNWKINGVASNFNAPPPAGTMTTDTAQGAAPPDEGTMTALRDAYTKAVAASDWTAVAILYTDSAVVGFTESPLLQGRAAIQARFTENFAGVTVPKIEIHDVGTIDFGNGWALDGGWYIFNFTAPAPAGKTTQPGAYLSLMRQQPDGSWKIHWSIVNGQPRPAS